MNVPCSYLFNHRDNCDYGASYITVTQTGDKYEAIDTDSVGNYAKYSITANVFVSLLNSSEWSLEPSCFVHYPTSLEEDKELDEFLFGGL